MPLLNAAILRQCAPMRAKDLPLEATTLAEAVAAIERLFKVRIVPHDQPKWFRVYPASGSPEFALVDIHIRRGDTTICPKQDLIFPLLPSDIINIGELLC